MNKIRKALLILGLASLVFTAAGCQENEQVSTTDKIGAQSEASTDAGQAKTVSSSQPKIIMASDDVTPAENGKPSLEFEDLVHDFGAIGPNVYVNCEFKFKNAGDGTLKFPKKPKAACGCTIPKLEKMEYAPGESGVIKVRYHSNSTPADIKKHLTVFSNDPEDPSLDLTIKAKIELAIVVTPASLNLSLKKENGGMEPIVITSKDGKEFSIKSFTSTGNIITADIDNTKKAIEYTITPKVDVTKLKGRLNGNINISLDHPNTNQVVLRYTTPPLYKVSSPQIFLINPNPDKPETREIMVISNYGEQVEIESILSSKKCIKVLSQENKGKGVKLVVEVTPKPQEKNLRIFYDTLSIKLKSGETLRINATGTYKVKKPHEKTTVKISN